MRVIFETTPTSMNLGLLAHPNQRTGRAFLRVIAFDPNEEPPPLPDGKSGRAITFRLSDLRREAGAGNPIVARPHPRSPFSGKLAPVAIPESVLASLPEDAQLQFRWRFEA